MIAHRSLFLLAVVLAAPICVRAQAQAPTDTSAAWQAVSRPSFAAGKSASVRNLAIVRDRIHITLNSGTLQFAEPVNGKVFAAAFRGSGKVQITPPNALEVQQLRIFS